MKRYDVRELSADELEQVSGAAELNFGPLQIVVGGDTAAFGIGIKGVGAFGITNDGNVCVGIVDGKGGVAGGCLL